MEKEWSAASQHGTHDTDDWRQKAKLNKCKTGDDMIAKLHGELDSQQERTFTRWWNSRLSSVGLSVENLCEDIKPGVLPIRLLEELSKSPAPRYNKAPRGMFMQIENHNTFLAELKKHKITLVNIGAEDLVSGNTKLVLGLTWTLILRYEIHQTGGNEQVLLNWVKNLCEGYDIAVEGGWAKGFSNGLAFSAIVHDAVPVALDLEAARNQPPPPVLNAAFDAAEAHLSVPRLLEAADFFDDGKSDEKSCILYVAKLKQAHDEVKSRRLSDEDEAALRAAQAAKAAEAARLAAERTRLDGMCAALEGDTAELERWITQTDARFRTACVQSGELGSDSASTRALLSALRDGFRGVEKPPREAEKAAVAGRYVAIGQLQNQYAQAVAESVEAGKVTAGMVTGEPQPAPSRAAPGALDAVWSMMQASEAAYESALLRQLAVYPVVSISISYIGLNRRDPAPPKPMAAAMSSSDHLAADNGSAAAEELMRRELQAAREEITRVTAALGRVTAERDAAVAEAQAATVQANAAMAQANAATAQANAAAASATPIVISPVTPAALPAAIRQLTASKEPLSPLSDARLAALSEEAAALSKEAAQLDAPKPTTSPSKRVLSSATSWQRAEHKKRAPELASAASAPPRLWGPPVNNEEFAELSGMRGQWLVDPDGGFVRVVGNLVGNFGGSVGAPEEFSVAARMAESSLRV